MKKYLLEISAFMLFIFSLLSFIVYVNFVTNTNLYLSVNFTLLFFICFGGLVGKWTTKLIIKFREKIRDRNNKLKNVSVYFWLRNEKMGDPYEFVRCYGINKINFSSSVAKNSGEKIDDIQKHIIFKSKGDIEELKNWIIFLESYNQLKFTGKSVLPIIFSFSFFQFALSNIGIVYQLSNTATSSSLGIKLFVTEAIAIVIICIVSLILTHNEKNQIRIFSVNILKGCIETIERQKKTTEN